MFYEEEIDRYHSVQFHYEAGTDNLHLKALAAKIWASFSEADQTEIEPKANRKSRLTGNPAIQSLAHRSDAVPVHTTCKAQQGYERLL